MSNPPTWPTPDPRPADLQDAIEVLGDQMCADVLRFLWPITSATTGTLMRGTGIKRPTLQKKLSLLERKGCITVDLPAGNDRTGRNLNYSVAHTRVLALLQAWVGYVFAQPSTAIPLPPPPFFGLGASDAKSAEI